MTNHAGCVGWRWLALAGLMLGTSVIAGPPALAQATSPSGVRGQQLSPAALTQLDLHNAGVEVPGWPRLVSEADQTDQAAEAAPSVPQGPVDPSGVVGAAAASTHAPTTNDLIAAGVVSVR
jgi:hypothetical protein